MPKNERILDCLIIGAGQAGLSAGRLAQHTGLNFMILERGEAAGAEWSRRAPEHLLFTPRALSKLPGLDLIEGPASGYPSNSEMARYFTQYAITFDLPLRTGSTVTNLSRNAGLFVVQLADGTTLRSHTVVLANGSNQEPLVPASLAEPIRQCTTQGTARDFWQSLPAPGARVLVVGDGASGRQTALDFAGKGYETTLSGAGRRLAPAHLLGRSLFAWLLSARLLRADRDTFRARLLRKLNPVPNKKTLGDASLKQAGVVQRAKLIGTLASLDGTGKPCGQANFEGGSACHFDHIVWCVGYNENSPFNTFATGKLDSWYTDGRGKTDVPGLFVAGRRWLTSRASELVLGAPRDAERVMAQVELYLSSRPMAIPQTELPSAIGDQHHA
ncbi:MAG: NAD(P)/FAD-dependent oxidoreductase [Cognatishimia sp.]|uniref:NAD(P)-binding domain-containing protein n=1 Tax=Cognatishimia sp. TaxID=2211648 RepID=UPI003B8B2416